jgi:hypothetical protein
MKARKPKVIICPKCRAMMVNRKKTKCCHCGQRLLYRGDFFFSSDDAFHWMGNSRGWVHVSDLIKKYNQEHPGRALLVA